MPSRNATHDGSAKQMTLSDRVKKFNRLDQEARGEEVNWTESKIDLGEMELGERLNSLKTDLTFQEYFELFCSQLDSNVGDILDLKGFQSNYPSAADFFFSRIDTNGDQHVQKSEMKVLFIKPDGSSDFKRLKKMANSITKLMVEEFDKSFDRLCDIVDQNHDNLISLEEFQLVHPEATQQIFAELDLNRDDVLSKEEFKQMFRLPPGTYDLPRVRDLTTVVVERVDKQFHAEFSDFLTLLGHHGGDELIEFAEFKTQSPDAFAVFFQLLEKQPQDNLGLDSLKKEFAFVDETWDIERLRNIRSNVTSEMKVKADLLDISFGWNSISQPFALYENKSLQSKKLYSGVRGEEIYVTDVGSEWVQVSSPMPGFVRVPEDFLRYVNQVKQFVAPEADTPGLSEGLLHAKLERASTARNEICVTEENDKFVFPHDEKFEIEFGWFQALPYGLKIYGEDKTSVIYTLVSGEEIHIVERQGPWVTLDSPMDGFLKITNDENLVVIKVIRNFITSITEKLTKKAADKHERIEESKVERQKMRQVSLKPKWKPSQKASGVSSRKAFSGDTGGHELPLGEPYRPTTGTEESVNFFTVVAEMADNRRRLKDLMAQIKMLQARQVNLQNSMLDKFDHVKEVATQKNISMRDLTNSINQLLGADMEESESSSSSSSNEVEVIATHPVVSPLPSDIVKVTEVGTGKDEITEIRRVIQTLTSEIKSTENVLLEVGEIPEPNRRDANKLRLDKMVDIPSSTYEIEEGSLPKGFYSPKTRSVEELFGKNTFT